MLKFFINSMGDAMWHEHSNNVREVPIKNSLLELLVKWGINESFPEMTSQLAIPGNNITLPPIGRLIKFAEISAEEEKRLIDDHQRKRIPPEGENGKEGELKTWAAIASVEKYKRPNVIKRLGKRVVRNLPERQMLLDPHGWLEKKFIKSFENSLPCNVPDVFAKRYEGLTEIEAKMAYSQWGLSAKLVGPDHYGELDSFLSDLCKKHGVKKPRVVMIDTDMPVAMAMPNWPKQEPVVYLSTSLLEIQHMNGVKGLLAHELKHTIDRKNTVTDLLRLWMDVYLTDAESVIREEKRADQFGVRATGHADAYNQGMIESVDRIQDYKRFAKQLHSLLEEHHIRPSALPEQLSRLFQFMHVNLRMLEDDPKIPRKLLNMRDPHPAMMKRFQDNIRTEERMDGPGYH